MPIATDTAKKAIASTLSALAEIGRSQLKSWTTQAKAQELYKKSRVLRNVKTIWQIEREVDLYEFYYRSSVVEERRRTQISDLSDFAYKGNLVVQGTAGQGKSTFLRYLACQELFLGGSIPVFAELRQLRPGTTVAQLAVRALALLGLDVDEPLLAGLAATGKLSMFLDGFDEIPDEMKAPAIEELEHLATRNEALRIIVSSRPHSGIAVSSRFRVIELAPLEGSEIPDIVRRLCASADLADGIVKGIESHVVRDLLTTPLMVSLLVFRYKAEQSIPENAAAFYQNLFSLLVLRHDQSKPGFVRKRKSGMGEVALENIFSATCFLAQRTTRGSFTTAEITGLVRRAMETLGEVGDPEKALDDFVYITGLVVRDGNECRFVHASVAEYHAACFIRDQPDPVAGQFYRSVAKSWIAWRQELGFLAILDTYRFKKLFEIPDAMKCLRIPTEADIVDWEPTVEFAKEFFQAETIFLSRMPGQFAMQVGWELRDAEHYLQRWKHGPSPILSLMPIAPVLWGKGLALDGLRRWESPYHGEDELVRLDDAIDYLPEIRAAVFDLLRAEHAKLLQMCREVLRVESRRSLLELD